MELEARKARAESLRGREARTFPASDLELRDNGDGTLSFTGYASVTERGYDMGWYQETIARDAFDATLARGPDVQLLINHTDLPIARSTVKFGPGSLRLSVDHIGLKPDATLDAEDSDVQRVARKYNQGLIDQMSFAFSGARSEWNDDYTERRITSLDIHRGDVSIVNQGANPFTSFSMRSIIQTLPEEQLAELRALLAIEASAVTAPAETLTVEAPAAPAPTRSLAWYKAQQFLLTGRG